MKPVAFEYLTDALKSLPGVGKKQAERIAYFLSLKDDKYISDLIERVHDAHEKIHFCKQCNNFAANELCDICANSLRDQTKLTIVSTIEDLQKIEDTNSYTGLYFVLNGEVDIKSKTNIDSKIIKQLMELINKKHFSEMLLATN
jgi:recombination protein RecR